VPHVADGNINMMLLPVKRPLQRLRLGVLVAVAIGLGTFWFASHPRKAKATEDRWDGVGYPLKNSEDDPISAFAGSVDLVGAPDFAFRMRFGSGLHGHNTIKIAADGRCKFVFYTRELVTEPDGSTAIDQKWRRIEFTIDQKTLKDLRKLLAEIDFFRLKKYYASDAQDGTQREVWVQASGMQKSVYCHMHFPNRFQKVYTFVIEKLIRPREQDLADAPVIDIAEVRRAGAHAW
jgi:hypothetical protein